MLSKFLPLLTGVGGIWSFLPRPSDLITCVKVTYAYWASPVCCLEFPLLLVPVSFWYPQIISYEEAVVIGYLSRTITPSFLRLLHSTFYCPISTPIRKHMDQKLSFAMNAAFLTKVSLGVGLTTILESSTITSQ